MTKINYKPSIFMVKNEIVTELLLNTNKNALRYIHNGCGFDFVAAFKAFQGSGAFTHNSILKVLNTFNIDPNTDHILMFIENPYNKSSYDNKSSYGVYTITSNNFIEYDASTYDVHNRHIYIREFNSFWKLFDDIRKNINVKYYFLIQKHDLLKHPKKIDKIDVLYNERVKPLIDRSVIGICPNKYKYPSSLCFMYNGIECNVARSRSASGFLEFDLNLSKQEIINNLFDKSGYYKHANTIPRRLRADEIIRQKKRNKASQFNFKPLLKELENLKTDCITHLKNMCTDVKNADDVSNIKSFSYSLKWALDAHEEFIRYMKNKTFTSEEMILKCFTRVKNNYLEALKDENI